MSFPRRYAVTRRFTLGAPRTPTVVSGGRRVLFLRSDAGDDPVHSLWLLDLDSGEERRLIDPRDLGVAGEDDLPAEERARRERARETGEGVVAYSVDREGGAAVAALGGRLVHVDLASGEVRTLEAEPGAFDPRIDPTGTVVAYVADGSLRAVGPDHADQLVIGESDVTWGAADFIAAEELGRTRGHWWSPDGTRLVVERVDESPVATWYISSPAEPWTEPRPVRYPAAGTANAACSLAVVDLDGGRVDVDWDADAHPYLVDVSWSEGGPLLVTVLDRPQREMLVLSVDADTGATTELHRQTDEAWVEVVPGAPAWHEGRLVTVADIDGARRVVVDGEPLSGGDVQVRSVVAVDDAGVLVTCSFEDPTEVQLALLGWDGELAALTSTPGIHGAAAGNGTLVVSRASMDEHGSAMVVVPDGDVEAAVTVASRAEVPDLEVDVRFLELGDRGLRAALLLPAGAGDEPLPVLLDPYGGPHAQRVLRSRGAFLVSQWLADQGFAVLVVDGRGTPGRGPAWERAVKGDLAGPVLDDQVEALRAAAEVEPRLDLSRVGIRGWSFGGYLAALAVLRRPDVFHAAVAGAPVTDWRLYDTAYTERYLGHPDEEPAAYERTDLTPLAPELDRPLLLVHGLADDNVVVAHTLQLSRALLEAGRSHTVLPLSGVTHMTPQEKVSENLLLLQVEFLRTALAVQP
ncbi:S9 family peptidase [Actinomarinicola tropica]|uniref:Prolyl oligopeptidase family serine peptidase n=1 Tax=Actinomarinicola tropica TaxID=2789776 RepID=A0A5Q2RRU6_9ACTN|nr:prolyl oligopeptidase family serine peptidase [Actinomarinicola tropica]QGG96620.1 prolyl oligopeptidase family serine peptidase [Actinomarinicola tropica]